ncbi:MAG: hypothetical protein AAGI37_19710 [Planctomycetota bacterium]
MSDEYVENPADGGDVDLSQYLPQDEPDQPEVEDRVDDEPEPEQPEEDAPEPEEAQPDPEQPKDDLSERWSKELQQAQQLNATYRRELERMQQNPSPEQRERVDKVKSRWDQIIEEGDGVDPYKATIDLAQESKSLDSQVRELKEQLAQSQAATVQQQQQMKAELSRLRFAASNPDVAGRYDEFAEQAHSYMQDKFGHLDQSQLSDAAWSQIASERFAMLVDQAKSEASASASEPPSVEETPKPKATKPITNKSGKARKQAPSPDDLEQDFLKQMSGYFGG